MELHSITFPGLPDPYKVAPASHLEDKNNPHGVTPAQIGAAPAVESADNPGCYYRVTDGVVEWLNPPMLLGEEYRTTERWNGKVVYRKAISWTSTGTIAGSFTVPHGISNFDKLVECFATLNKTMLLPYEDANYSARVSKVDSSGISVANSNPYFDQNYTWYFELAYTKTV